MKAVLLAIAAVIIIGGGAYLALHNSSSTTQTPAPTHASSSSSKTATPPSAADTMAYDGTQFSPASLTVKAGSQVTIKNSSSQALQLQSNPHPAHTDDTDLNVGLVAAGQSKTFTVTKTGTFGYHNHLDPSIQGKITVE